MQFDTIQSEDFVTFSRVQPPHVKLEQYLIELGGTGVKGAEFKKQALTNAGWNYGALVSYGRHPDAAAKAFNFIREVVEEDGLTPEDILEQIKTKADLHQHSFEETKAKKMAIN